MKTAFERSRGRRSGSIRWIILLLLFAVILALIVVALLKDGQTDELPTTFSAVVHPSLEVTPTPEIVTRPTGTLSENDPEEIAKIERFFGPLPVVSEPQIIVHRQVRGLYLLDGVNLDQTIKLARAGHINAAVLDFKEDYGLSYASQIDLAQQIGASHEVDMRSRVQRLKSEGLIVIARIVCFKDQRLVEARPEQAIRDEDGNVLLFTGDGGSAFLSPYDTRNWDYFIAVAKEAIEMGVDEIQFDYVRFPTGATTSGNGPYFGDPETTPSRAQAINRFIETARVEIEDRYGIPVGVDVFSIVMSSPLDGDFLGQSWRTIGRTGVDNICPMIYPSHYANASVNHYTGNGEGTYLGGRLFEIPDFYPQEVTRLALLEGRTALLAGRYAHVRPFLQAFTATYLPEGYYQTYGPEEVRASIQGTYDAGFDEWILWSPHGDYSEAIFTGGE